MEWKDSTSYSRGERGKTAPRSWTLGEDHLKSICVHRHRDYPGSWLVTCYALGIDKFDLGVVEVDVARTRALRVAGRRLAELCKYYAALGCVDLEPRTP